MSLKSTLMKTPQYVQGAPTSDKFQLKPQQSTIIAAPAIDADDPVRTLTFKTQRPLGHHFKEDDKVL
jgi:hypothetical protein